MDEVVMLLGQKTREILNYALENNIPMNFCYMSGGKWQKGSALLIHVDDDRINIQLKPKLKAKVTNIKKGRMAGVWFKDKSQSGHDRFIFGTEVMSVIRSNDIFNEEIVELEYPEEVEVIRNKHFIRSDVPSELNVEVELTHREVSTEPNPIVDVEDQGPSKGKLINLAANGLYVTVEEEQNADFQKGGYVGVKFTPGANESPICFNAYVSEVIQAFNTNDIGMQLEIIGLEASPEGRMVLRRLCNVINVYRRDVSKEQVTMQKEFQVSSTPLYLS